MKPVYYLVMYFRMAMSRKLSLVYQHPRQYSGSILRSLYHAYLVLAARPSFFLLTFHKQGPLFFFQTHYNIHVLTPVYLRRAMHVRNFISQPVFFHSNHHLQYTAEMYTSFKPHQREVLYPVLHQSLRTTLTAHFITPLSLT